jgi:hypothetical protein
MSFVLLRVQSANHDYAKGLRPLAESILVPGLEEVSI